MKEGSHCLASTCSETPAHKGLRYALGNTILQTRCLLQNRILKNIERLFFLSLTLIFWKTTRWVLLQLLTLQGLRLWWVTLLHTMTFWKPSAELSNQLQSEKNKFANCSFFGAPSQCQAELWTDANRCIAPGSGNLGLHEWFCWFLPAGGRCSWSCERISHGKIYKIHPFHSREVNANVSDWCPFSFLDEFSFQSESPLSERTSKCFKTGN